MNQHPKSAKSFQKMSSPVVKHVVVLIAMEAEANPLLTKLGLAEVDASYPNLPCKMYSGVHNGLLVTVVTNGKCLKYGVDNVGTSPAVLSAYAAVNQFHPDLVINAGTAGGFIRKGAAIGDAFISSFIRHHDRRIALAGFEEYGVGHHVSLSVPNLVEVDAFGYFVCQLVSIISVVFCLM